jgi:hypothetical protein
VLIPLLVALQAQATVPKVELTTPATAVNLDFSQIRGVRELSDGRLIVSDRLEQKVVVLTPRSGATETISRTGSGPVEYRLPTGVFPIPGDSSLLMDEGNSRVAIIGPDLKVKRTFVLNLPDIGYPLTARGRDESGRFILAIPAWLHSRGPQKDSVVLVRFDPRSNRVDTLAVLKGATPPPHPEYSPVPRIPMVIFSPQDVYGVSADGWVVVARSSDYHVEWLSPAGAWTKGARVPFDQITVTEPEKSAYAKRFMERSNIGGKSPEGMVPAGGVEQTRPEAISSLVKATTWAEKKGPFTESAPIMAGDGTAWLERSGAMNSAIVYDVFNRKGERVRQVQLPRGRRLIAVGKASAYLITTDADGLEKLELYSIR